MHPALLEVQSGPHHELLDRARDVGLAGIGQGADAGADVHRHAGDVLADQLDLAGVDAGADAEVEGRGSRGGRCAAEGEGAVGLVGGAAADEELLDLVEDRVLVAVEDGRRDRRGSSRRRGLDAVASTQRDDLDLPLGSRCPRSPP